MHTHTYMHTHTHWQVMAVVEKQLLEVLQNTENTPSQVWRGAYPAGGSI